MSFNFVSLVTKETQTEAGGLTEFYNAVGTVRKTAYAILVCPSVAKLCTKFGRYHHDVKWSKIRPKLLHERWSE